MPIAMMALSRAATVTPKQAVTSRSLSRTSRAGVPRQSACTIAAATPFAGRQLTAGLTAPRQRFRNGSGSRSVATMSLFGLGPAELLVIGGVAAVVFGPSKLPELGKSLGKTVKN